MDEEIKLKFDTRHAALAAIGEQCLKDALRVLAEHDLDAAREVQERYNEYGVRDFNERLRDAGRETFLRDEMDVVR